jgi:S1/P1 Nuclease
MKNKQTSLLFSMLIILLTSITVFAWGAKGHELINKRSVDFLPPEMKSFTAWRDYLEEHAPDADNRKKIDKSEPPKHFIDIDYYKEFLNGRMIHDEKELIAKYGEETVIKNGILPWATLQTYENLIADFKSGDKAKALQDAADLGHYVGDGHQPMHTVVNYNGQLTDQKGVHARYEITMVDAHLNELDSAFQPVSAPYVKDPLNFIFNYISGSNSVCDILFDADNLAYKETGSREDDDYYRIMWFRTKYITKVQFNHAAEDLASLIYTAWVNAGKPSFSSMK